MSVDERDGAGFGATTRNGAGCGGDGEEADWPFSEITDAAIHTTKAAAMQEPRSVVEVRRAASRESCMDAFEPPKGHSAYTTRDSYSSRE